MVDIETSPSLGYTWGKYEQNVIEFKQPWYLLCFSYKYLDSTKIITKALPDYPSYKRTKHNDRALVKDLWKVLDHADIVIAQNGDAFDIKKAKARFLFHKLEPPSPFRSIDTLKVLRRYFNFDSNKLDDISKELKIGSKLPHTGWNLWKGCMEGNKKAWALMKRYNVHDIILLEKLYLRIRPWIENHPNLALFQDGRMKVCTNCGAENSLVKFGFKLTRTGKFQAYQCKKCGARVRDRKSIKTDVEVV